MICASCGGSGRHFIARRGGTDPEVIDWGECEDCEGGGVHLCDDCRKGAATIVLHGEGRTRLLCEVCHRERVGED